MSIKSTVTTLTKSLTANATRISNKLIRIWQSWHFGIISSLPLLIAFVVFLSVVGLKHPLLFPGLLGGSLMVIVIQQVKQQVHLSKPWLILLQILIGSVVLCFFWLDYFAAPAYAQFFGKAEDFLQNTLSQGSGNNTNSQPAISLIFNVLRAIYLLYIAVSLIGVINAVRKDEDWQSIARVPLLVVVAVTVADVLTGFVIGDVSK